MGIFYEGDLQSGIALAVQQSQAVLCFVYDSSETSTAWESHLVEDDQITPCIIANAVAFRLEFGSVEAGFLSSILPLSSAPAIIVIKNGALRENIAHHADSPVSMDSLQTRVRAALEGSPATVPSETARPLPEEEQLNRASDATDRPHDSLHDSQAMEAPSPDPLPSDHATSPPSAPPVASTAATTAATSSVPSARGLNSSRSQSQNPQLTGSPATPATGVRQGQQSQRAEYIKMQKERERKQREEREGIKNRIKHDRAERRRQEEMRKQPTVDPNHEASPTPKSSNLRIQVRTFDGSTLRNSFSTTCTVASDIRPWIDSSIKQRIPYTLKIILTPLPNRPIEPAEEDDPLTDLGIRGSCTLVMVPVSGYVESYEEPRTGLGSVVTGGYGLAAGTVGAVYDGVRTFLGLVSGQRRSEVHSGGTAASSSALASPPDPNEDPQSESGPSQARIRTLADQREAERRNPDPHQLYNGNQLNFQPRREHDSDKGSEDKKLD